MKVIKLMFFNDLTITFFPISLHVKMNIFKDIKFLKYPTKLLLRKYDYMSIILL